jgi:hypothetical protein
MSTVTFFISIEHVYRVRAGNPLKLIDITNRRLIGEQNLNCGSDPKRVLGIALCPAYASAKSANQETRHDH